MYDGKHPIALQSQKMMSDALFDLMKERPFQDIRVKEICEKAHVSRQTFYTLFKQKERIIAWRLETLFNEHFKGQKIEMNIHELFCTLVSCLIFHSSIFSLLYQNHLEYLVYAHLLNHLSSRQWIGEKYDGYSSAFLAGAFVGVMAKAIENHCFDQPEQIVSMMEEMLSKRFFQ